MVMLSDSEPSISVRREAICRSMAVSSLPLAVCAVSCGASASAFTVTRWSMVVWWISPSRSVVVAVMLRCKSWSLLDGGVTVRPCSCAGVRV